MRLLQEATATAVQSQYTGPLTQIAAQFSNMCNMVEATLDLEVRSARRCRALHGGAV